MAGRMLKTAVCGMLLGFGAVQGQINLLSDQITFRNSANQDQTTYHYGEFNVSSSSDYGILVGNPYVGYFITCEQTGGRIWCGGTGVEVQVMPNIYAWHGDCYGGSFIAGRPSGEPYARVTGVYAYGEGGGSGTGYGFGIDATCSGPNGTALYAHGNVGSYAGYFEGTVFMNGEIVSSSDRKFKTDIAPVDNALDRIMQLKPKTYFYDTITYKEKNFPKNRQFGLIAQDVQTVFPDLVRDEIELTADSVYTDKDGKVKRVKKESKKEKETFKSVNYMALIPVLVAALQEQQKEIEELKTALGNR